MVVQLGQSRHSLGDSTYKVINSFEFIIVHFRWSWAVELLKKEEDSSAYQRSGEEASFFCIET